MLLALVACLFVLAMVEAALLHARRSAVAADAAAGDPGSKRLLGLLDELPTVMNTVLLAVLLVQVSSTAIAGALAQRWFGGTGITIATVAVTVVLFIYGEAIPKTIALADPARHAERFSQMIQVLSAVLGPIVSVLVRIAKLQYRGDSTADTVSAVSEGELLHLTGEAAAAGRIDPSDADLITKSFTLGDLRVGEILIPMSDVVSVSTSTSVASALRTAIDAGHRRIVVHNRSPEQIVGFVRLRDLADPPSAGDDAGAGSLVRSALGVDSSALVIDVLREMQRTRCHLAVVTGDDGATVGIVTVEDIVEELLGKIDEPDPRERRAPEHPPENGR
jgi:CBS domain containing-hemolysin-like protein